MTLISMDALAGVLQEIIAAQPGAVAAWHEAEPKGLDEPAPEADLDTLRTLAVSQHLCNHRLWHVEDEARRTDVGPEVIADCKRRIDALNQKRNDLIERVDACLVALVTPLVPEGASERYNTETAGMALDRLSIIALKVHHMREQAQRADASDEHRHSCAAKLAVLDEQRADLARAVGELLAEYVAGTKRPKVYYQFKMYNDPSLNPALYAARAVREADKG